MVQKNNTKVNVDDLAQLYGIIAENKRKIIYDIEMNLQNKKNNNLSIVCSFIIMDILYRSMSEI